MYLYQSFWAGVNCTYLLQVYTAEEKAALAMFNAEENKRKEQKILADMQRLVQRTIGGIQDTGDDDSG